MKKREFVRNLALSTAGITLMSALPGCSSSRQQGGLPLNWAWLTAREESDDEWNTIFTRLKKAKISGLHLRAPADIYRRIIPQAEKHGIDIHAWIITLNRAWDEEARKHPDWYTVSRNGDSCLDMRPYVDHYQWVCPSKEEVCQYVENEVLSLMQIKGLRGVHLDYIRYVDVILPVGLWKKYNLVQDREYPEFDFCYCDTCRKKFLAESGIDIRSLEDPTQSKEWRRYRWDSVTRFVNRLAERVRSDHPRKMLTAAVFPYPEISRMICRQDWAEWNLDAFFPMIYHSFYNEEIPWIGSAVARGVEDLKGRAPLYAGLFVPALPPDRLSEAVNVSMDNGAAGICWFNYESLSEEHHRVLREIAVR
ncbi:MAG: family 10 glycosylhydrolase [Bacteroidales bacterium]|nr:family 10 glycosylhydrolase [Bacteroidales bacterium]MDT8372538.1 family 10 glycosylhydrolase [Bacteroidales bacterium]